MPPETNWMRPFQFLMFISLCLCLVSSPTLADETLVGSWSGDNVSLTIYSDGEGGLRGSLERIKSGIRFSFEGSNVDNAINGTLFGSNGHALPVEGSYSGGTLKLRVGNKDLTLSRG